MADQGYGITITFQTGFFAEVLSVTLNGISRTAIPTTHSTTTSGWMTFLMSDLKDGGTIEVEFQFDPDETPPIDQAAESVTVTFPVPPGQSNGGTMVATAGMTDMSISVPVDDKMTASATLKISGVPVWTDAS